MQAVIKTQYKPFHDFSFSYPVQFMPFQKASFSQCSGSSAKQNFVRNFFFCHATSQAHLNVLAISLCKVLGEKWILWESLTQHFKFYILHFTLNFLRTFTQFFSHIWCQNIILHTQVPMKQFNLPIWSHVQYKVFEFPLHTLHLLYSREIWTTDSIAVLCIPLDCRIRPAGRCTAPQTADGRHSRHIATVTIFIQQKRIRKCGSLCKTFSEYSQRERDHSHPPKHQFRAWKSLSVVAVCLCTTSKYCQLPLLNFDMDLLPATWTEAQPRA